MVKIDDKLNETKADKSLNYWYFGVLVFLVLQILFYGFLTQMLQ